jgi:N-acetylglutamate synthase
MDLNIREMTSLDFDAVICLWKQSEGIGLTSADEPANLAHFLERNPHLSFVAVDGGKLIGAVMCGHDGRRGFIYHLAVAAPQRQQGIGTRLVEQCLNGLQVLKIEKCHIFVYSNNEKGLNFWRTSGFKHRPELELLSHPL